MVGGSGVYLSTTRVVRSWIMRLGPMHNKLLLSDLFYPLCNILVGSLFVQPLIDLYRMSWSNGDKESYNCSFLMSVGLVCCPNNFSLFLFSSSKKGPKHHWSLFSITFCSGPKPLRRDNGISLLYHNKQYPTTSPFSLSSIKEGFPLPFVVGQSLSEETMVSPSCIIRNSMTNIG